MKNRVKIHCAVLFLLTGALLLAGIGVMKADKNESTGPLGSLCDKIWEEYDLVEGDAIPITIYKEGMHQLRCTADYKEPAN